MAKLKSETSKIVRCRWVGEDPLYITYHDEEWGVPVHDDVGHFTAIVLETAQAGLSWKTVLKRKEAYGKAFAGFDAKKVARFTDERVEKLMLNEAIIRNRMKITATISNAQAFLDVQKQEGSFDHFIWDFVKHKTKKNKWGPLAEIPATSDEAIALSKEMKARGFKFMGPTIVYAHMQATGLVNDHSTHCFRYTKV